MRRAVTKIPPFLISRHKSLVTKFRQDRNLISIRESLSFLLDNRQLFSESRFSLENLSKLWKWVSFFCRAYCNTNSPPPKLNYLSTENRAVVSYV